MTTLYLGVREMPYAAVFEPPQQQYEWAKRALVREHSLAQAQKAYGSGGKTTGQVAGFLEARYKIMRVFYEHEKARVIIPAIMTSVKGAVINVMNGQPGTIDIAAEGMNLIGEAFKDSLTEQKYDAWIGGGKVPTKASLPTKTRKGGISHRFKTGVNPKGARPSFVDTGLFRSSFIAWMD
jgi:hypothetical protein